MDRGTVQIPCWEIFSALSWKGFVTLIIETLSSPAGESQR